MYDLLVNLCSNALEYGGVIVRVSLGSKIKPTRTTLQGT